MTDPGYVINEAQSATLGHQAAAAAAGGKAYQLIAQSAAISLQDAATALRQATMVANAAAGAAFAEFLAAGDPKYLDGVAASREMIKAAIADFSATAAAATAILNDTRPQ